MKQKRFGGLAFVLVLVMIMSLFVAPLGVMATETEPETMVNSEIESQPNRDTIDSNMEETENTEAQQTVNTKDTEENSFNFIPMGEEEEESQTQPLSVNAGGGSWVYDFPTYGAIYAVSIGAIEGGSLTAYSDSGSYVGNDSFMVTAGGILDIQASPDSGYELVENTLHYKVNGVGAEVAIAKDAQGRYSFLMPTENIHISAQFQKSGSDVFINNHLNVNREYWNLTFADTLFNEMHIWENQEVFLTLKKDGETVMPEQKCSLKWMELYFYRTANIQRGTYEADITIRYMEDGNAKERLLTAVPLVFDDILNISQIQMDSGEISVSQSAFSVEVSIDSNFADLENLELKLVNAHEPKNTLTADRKEYSLINGYDSAHVEFFFENENILMGEYEMVVTYPGGAVTRHDESIWATQGAVLNNGKWNKEEQTITFDAYGIPDGGYSNTYYINSSPIMGSTMAAVTAVISNQKGSIDISALGLGTVSGMPVDPSMNFIVDMGGYHGELYVNTFGQEYINDDWGIWLEDSASFDEEIPDQMYANEFISSSEKTLGYYIEDHTRADSPKAMPKYMALVKMGGFTGIEYIGTVLQRMETSKLTEKDEEGNLFGSFEAPAGGWDMNEIYALVLTDEEAMEFGMESYVFLTFKACDKPYFSIDSRRLGSDNIVKYYNNTAYTLPMGEVNITDSSKLTFYDQNNAVIPMSRTETKNYNSFDMTGKENRTKVTAQYDGKAVMFPVDELEFLRLDNGMARVFRSLETIEGAMYAVEGISLNKATSLEAQVFKENGEYLEFAAKAQLTKESDTRALVPQSLFAGLPECGYTILYLVDGYPQYGMSWYYSGSGAVTDTFKVTFVDHDGTVLKVQEGIAKGNSAVAPTIEKNHKGYEFKNWDRSFSNITENITVTAICVPVTYTVNFHSMGGSPVASYSGISYGSIIAQPEKPTLEGYTFAGWYSDYLLKTPWDFTTNKVEANLTLYAKWNLPVGNITCNTPTNGILTCTPSAFAGDVVKVTATPNSGYKLNSLIYEYGILKVQAAATANSQNEYQFVMPRGGDVTLTATFEKQNTLTVNVTELKSSDYTVSLSGNNYYSYKYTEEGQATVFNDLMNGNYWLNLSTGEEDNYYSYSKYIMVNSENITETITIPVTYVVSGKITANIPLTENLFVQMSDSSTGKWYYSSAELDGTYSIKGVQSGDYTLNISNSKYAGEMSVSVNVNNANVENVDFTLTKGADLRVNLKKQDGGTIPERGWLYLEKKSGTSWNYVSSANGGGEGVYSFDGSLHEAGIYRVYISSLNNLNYTEYPFVSEGKEFTVTDTDITSGTISQELSYGDSVNLSEALKGEGNYVITDLKTVLINGKVQLEIKYKNNSRTTIRPTFKIEVGQGMTVNGNQDSHDAGNLKSGETGKHKAIINIGNVDSDSANIKVTVTIDGKVYNFGSAVIELMSVNLTAPGSVKTGDAFTVYGEATEGSSVAIKDAKSGKTFATVVPRGKFYTASIVLPQDGEYNLVAEARRDSSVKTSQPVTVQATSTPIEAIAMVKDGYLTLTKNPRLNVFVFNQYVDMQLMGQSFTLDTKFSNSSEITSVMFEFSGKAFSSVRSGDSFKASFSGWAGTGLKPITAVITKINGQKMKMIVAEVTVLIDPSGTVKNALTNDPIAGAKTQCYVLDGDVWKLWDAENYGQTNPDYTDASGNYGWMVPDGKYRVTATLEGFEDYDTLEDPKFSSGGESTIVIPPARDDVHFAMTPKTYNLNVVQPQEGGTISVNSSAQYTETVTVAVTAAEGKELDSLTVKTISEKAVISTGNTFTMPAENVIVTAVFKEKGTTGTGGGNSGSGGGSSTIVPKPSEEATTTTVTNPDGSTVTTVTDPKNGTITQNRKDTNGVVTETTGKNGGSVTASVTIPSNVKNAKITIPVKEVSGKNPTNKMVAVIVNSDGSETIITKSVVQGGNVVFNLSASGKIKMIENEKNFGDAQKHWSKDAVDFVTARNLFNGTSDTEFSPNQNMSRAMLVTVLYRLEQAAKQENQTKFSDVPSGQWFADAVNWAASNSLVSGMNETTFAPNADITREQLAVILYNYAKFAGMDLQASKGLQAYSDAQSVSPWASEAMTWAVEKGIITGKGEQKLESQALASRGEVATMIQRYTSLTVK